MIHSRRFLTLAVWSTSWASALSLVRAEDLKLANPGFEQSSGEKAAGWTESYWFKTPPQAVTITQNERHAGRNSLQMVLEHPITEVGYNEGGFQISLSQKLPRMDPSSKVRISFWYKTQARIPLEIALSGGSGCERPTARTGPWMTAPGKEWTRWEGELDARQFGPANTFYKGSMWLEIMVNGQASPLPATLFLDDVRIEVINPSSEKADADPTWPKRLEKLSGRLQTIRQSLGRSEESPELARKRAFWSEDLSAKQTQLSTDLKKLRPPTVLQKRDFAKKLASLETHVDALQNGSLLVLKDLTLYQVAAVSNQRILPKDAAIPGSITTDIQLTAAGDEYEAASFVLQSQADISELQLTASPFLDAHGKPLANITPDIRVVKCWYQDESIAARPLPPDGAYNPIDRGGFRQLIPELLVYDDALIRVDYGARDNFVRGNFSDGERYIPVSRIEGVLPGNELKDFPVYDASSLRPVSFPAGQNRQFWITVDVPKDTPPGIYHSTVSLTSPAGSAGQFRIALRILPFSLPAPFVVNSIFYRYPSPQFYGEKVWQQFRLEIRNLLAHGLEIPVLHTLFPLGSSRQGVVDTAPPFLLKEILLFDPAKEGIDISLLLQDLEHKLRILREEGVVSRKLFLDGLPVGFPDAPEALAVLEKRAKAVVDLARKYAFEDVYFYGIDEARRSVLEKQRPAWQAIHRAGGRIFSSGATEQLDAVGDLLDLSITILPPERSIARAWHDRGHLVAAYGNPQGGVEEPDTYRRNFGILLWQANFDGAMTYLYHNATIQNSKDVPADANTISWASSWNDFCPNPDQTKQHNMVYPTAEGVLDTIQWEGYREGLDDVRYLRVLETLLQIASSSTDPAVASALAWMESIRQGNINQGTQSPSSIREACITHILAVSAVTQPANP